MKDSLKSRKKFIKELKFYEDNDECPTCNNRSRRKEKFVVTLESLKDLIRN